MAVLAAIALAATVVVARRGLEDAAQVVARGEGEALVIALQRELSVDGPGTSDASLEAHLGEHASAGLRYLAVVRDDQTLARAGASTMTETSLREGEVSVVGGRVRMVARLGPPKGAHPDHGPPPHDRHFDGPPPDHPDFGGGPRPGGPPHPPLLVVELETPILDALRAEMTRTVVVGGAAAFVLLAFAIAWWRSATQLAAIEQKAELERRLVALGRMSSVMAHELRNPLASLKGHGQLLLESLDPGSKTHEKAARVVGDAERLERLIDSLLEFAREGPLDRASVPPAELVRRALEHLPRDGVQIDLDRAPAEMWVDEARVARALSNLVENARQASPAGEPVELSVVKDRDDVLIDVRDHGPGIAEDERARVFEPFVTTKVRGTGLGLPIARRVAEQHGGTLVAEAHPDGGALFRMRLPDATRQMTG